mmetsp:Transcript_2472/g.5530  ORF Transcript_2472/g.5530 Transcript_2472/m.5530 type:complete len:311 (+) Transcript_2472:1220-2152(+)
MPLDRSLNVAGSGHVLLRCLFALSLCPLPRGLGITPLGLAASNLVLHLVALELVGLELLLALHLCRPTPTLVFVEEVLNLFGLCQVQLEHLLPSLFRCIALPFFALALLLLGSDLRRELAHPLVHALEGLFPLVIIQAPRCFLLLALPFRPPGCTDQLPRSCVRVPELALQLPLALGTSALCLLSLAFGKLPPFLRVDEVLLEFGLPDDLRPRLLDPGDLAVLAALLSVEPAPLGIVPGLVVLESFPESSAELARLVLLVFVPPSLAVLPSLLVPHSVVFASLATLLQTLLPLRLRLRLPVVVLDQLCTM